MNTVLPAIALAAALSGCASSSGVFASCPDSYKVSSTAITSFGGAATAKGDAYRKATATCAQQGKQVQFGDQQTDTQFTGASVDLSFKCAPK